jgi:hypothetical protein
MFLELASSLGFTAVCQKPFAQPARASQKPFLFCNPKGCEIVAGGRSEA